MMKITSKYQLLFLFASSFVILFTGMGLFPVLPLYAASFGASQEVIGWYYAIIYFSLAAGPLFASWITRRMSRQAAFVASGLIGTPALFLLGQSTELWHVVALTSLVWFSGGAALALISILTGVHASGSGRGKSFGLMAVASPLGALVGGLVVGRVIEAQGYSVLFTGMSVFWTLLPLIGLVFIRDADGRTRRTTAGGERAGSSGFGARFILMLATTLLAAIGITFLRLGSPMLMKSMGFSATALSSTATVSGLVAIPVTLALGAFSDRFGRYRSLIVVYLVAATGSLVLSVSGQLAHFWVVSALTMIAFGANGALVSALATDLLPAEKLNSGLSWINSLNSASGIVSFASSGYLLGLLGPHSLYLLTALFPIVAISLLELGQLTAGRLPAVPSIHLLNRKPAAEEAC